MKIVNQILSLGLALSAGYAGAVASTPTGYTAHKFSSNTLQDICSSYQTYGLMKDENERIEKTLDLLKRIAGSTDCTGLEGDLSAQIKALKGTLDLTSPGFEVDLRLVAKIADIKKLVLANSGRKHLYGLGVEYTAPDTTKETIPNNHVTDIKELDVSGNQLKDLEEIKVYEKLRVIDASNNDLTTVLNPNNAENPKSGRLPKLEYVVSLDVSYNPSLKSSREDGMLYRSRKTLVQLDVSYTGMNTIAEDVQFNDLSILIADGIEFDANKLLLRSQMQSLIYLSAQNSKGFPTDKLASKASGLIYADFSGAEISGAAQGFESLANLAYLRLDHVQGLPTTMDLSNLIGLSLFDVKVDVNAQSIETLDSRGPNALGNQVSGTVYEMRDGGNGSKALHGDRLSALIDTEVCELRDSTGQCVRNYYTCDTPVEYSERVDPSMGLIEEFECQNDLVGPSGVVLNGGTKVEIPKLYY